eukprot:2551718-Rhodomonas_salina.3
MQVTSSQCKAMSAWMAEAEGFGDQAEARKTSPENENGGNPGAVTGCIHQGDQDEAGRGRTDTPGVLRRGGGGGGDVGPNQNKQVAVEGEGDLVHYNSLTVDPDTINRGIKTDYEIVRRMTKKGGKYWGWVTRREGRVTVKGQDGSVSAQGSGMTKEEAREDMARLLLVRIQASKKLLREETKLDIRKQYEALV